MWEVLQKPASLTFVAMTAAVLALIPPWPATQPSMPEDILLPLDCKSFEEITELELLVSGLTKVVYQGKFRGRRIAFKMIDIDGVETESCTSAGTFSRCFTITSAKILREIILSQHLDHPNVVKILGWCIPSSDGPVWIATELGSPLEYVALQRLTWEEKLKILVSIGSLLHLLAHSPLGSLALADLKRRRFAVVEGVVKLSDFDGIKTDEPTCKHHTDCRLFTGKGIRHVACVSGRCKGYNEEANILQAGDDLLCPILVDAGPKELQPLIKSIIAAYKGETGWNSTQILKETQTLVKLSG